MRYKHLTKFTILHDENSQCVGHRVSTTKHNKARLGQAHSGDRAR